MRYGGKQGDCYRNFEGKKKNHASDDYLAIAYPISTYIFHVCYQPQHGNGLHMNEFVLKS
jgi:hypothetical protein